MSNVGREKEELKQLTFHLWQPSLKRGVRRQPTYVTVRRKLQESVHHYFCCEETSCSSATMIFSPRGDFSSLGGGGVHRTACIYYPAHKSRHWRHWSCRRPPLLTYAYFPSQFPPSLVDFQRLTCDFPDHVCRLIWQKILFDRQTSRKASRYHHNRWIMAYVIPKEYSICSACHGP